MTRMSQFVVRARDALRRGARRTDAALASQGRGQPADRPVATPAVDILENPKELRIIADVPGALPGRAAISCAADNVLTLEAAVAAGQPAATPLFMEYEPRDWRRCFQVPLGYDGSKAKAELRQGLLTVSIPRREDEGPRVIPVHSR